MGAVGLPLIVLAGRQLESDCREYFSSLLGTAGQPFQPRPDPLLANDLTPWLLRRLALATAMARELRQAEVQAVRG